MKATIRSLICAAVVLTTLGANTPVARADDTTDYINQIYADQAAADAYQAQLQQTQDYINQIYADQAARDAYQAQLQQTQDYINQINNRDQ
jgi:Tfp pilus assembly protein PilP